MSIAVIMRRPLKWYDDDIHLFTQAHIYQPLRQHTDPTQHAKTTPAPCRTDGLTTPLPSPTHDSDPLQEECGGNQDSSLQYAVYGMATLCALLLLFSLALCVRIFTVMRIKGKCCLCLCVCKKKEAREGGKEGGLKRKAKERGSKRRR